MDRRQHLIDELREALQIEHDQNGEPIVTLHGVVLGRLRRDAVTGRWRLDWRGADWTPTPTQLEGDRPVEHAEGWARGEIASLFAMERQAMEEGKRLGVTPGSSPC